MEFDSELAVGLLDFEFCCCRLYTEGVVVCGFHDHDCRYSESIVSGGGVLEEYALGARRQPTDARRENRCTATVDVTR